MAYVATTWDSDTAITATKMNHLESQYATANTDFMAGHTHSSQYYTKDESRLKFFSALNMGKGSGSDADKLDGHYPADIINLGLPTGAIMWWSKSSGLVPSGWHVCDGAGGTTDYRDKFVVGAGDTYTVKDSVGQAAVTPVSSTIHIGEHSVTTDEIPEHSHSYTDYYSQSYHYAQAAQAGSFYMNGNIVGSTKTTAIAGSGSTHNHETGSSINYNQESNLPPYYALYLIQKVT
jgi:hypothetical protein